MRKILLLIGNTINETPTILACTERRDGFCKEARTRSDTGSKWHAARIRSTVLAAVVFLLLAVAGFSSAWHLTNRSSPATGFVLKKYVDAQGLEHNYLVYVPYDFQEGEERPLLLFLHGVGESGSDGLSSIINNFGIQVWEQKRTFPFIVAIPQCRLWHNWSGAELERGLAIMDRVAEDYKTDPDRVYVTGVSSGGSAVWEAASSYPQRFAAAVPVCGSRADAQSLGKSQLPIWNFYNKGDATGLVEFNRSLRQELLQTGMSPIVTEFSQQGHDAWSHAYRSMGMLEWLLEQTRSGNVRHGKRFKLLPPRTLLTTWRVSGTADWCIGEEDELVCIRGAGPVSGLLISDQAYEACDLHLDVYIDSASAGCQIKLLEHDDDITGYTIEFASTDSGSGLLSHSTRGPVAVLEPAAQRQLVVGWNDIRIKIRKGRIEARINGWKAIDVQIPSASDPLRLALVAPGDGSAACWRNLRIRVGA